MAKAWKVRGIHPQQSYRRSAKVILAVKVEEVYSWSELIRDPDNIKELHSLRISVKRLRYSMEFFAINYEEEFQDSLDVLTDLQEELGDIHDYDVIEMVLTDYLQGLLDRGDSEADVIGINVLVLHYRNKRAAKYQAFLQQWIRLEKADFKRQLLKIITNENQ